MNILIVGSGAREHALAWKVAQSPRLSQLYIAPGNAGTEGPTPQSHKGTAALGGRSAASNVQPRNPTRGPLRWGAAPLRPTSNVPIHAEDIPALVAFARERNIDFVIIGPEVPLAAGLTDALQAAGKKVFGPSQAAAQIEWSKTFAKDFMARHNIPTARYATFSDFYDAIGHLLTVDYPVVIKAAGLAAGKGVIVPDCADDAEAALRQIMLDKEFGAAGDQVVIEERLMGKEVSLMAFTDGVSVRAMPPAQDHKRLLDADRGPNTGGMGAYAPTPICPPPLADELTRTILQAAVDGLRAEGRRFAGVLYAGLMLTADGPRVLEFNGRFGDPETQVILPLLESDLIDIAEACADGTLANIDVRWKSGAAACVVLASEGYPGKYASGRVITGLDTRVADGIIFHAGTKREDEQVVTAGGRVLSVTGLGSTLPAALDKAYTVVQQVSFEGMQYRKDIGYRALAAAR